MSSAKHSKIRFIGYTIPTTPANMVAIGNPNGPGAVAGTYLASVDLASDIAARIAVLKNAVEAAKAALQGQDNSDEVSNIFLAPEFFFHGQQGPYIFDHETPDPVELILAELAKVFTKEDYPNWTFIFGSAITAKVANITQIYAANSTSVRNNVVEALSKQWLAAFGPLQGVVFDMLVNFIKNCHSYPSLEVRNRALIISNIALDTPSKPLNTHAMTSEKYFCSNEDFLLYDVTGNTNIVTEQMTAYPYIDLSNGDLKHSAFDKHAIFRQNYGADNFPQYMDFGIEICLDHSDVRLRSNIDNEPFPANGDALHVQLIPSCGMQISLASIAADTNGFVFNCDGQYALDSSISQALQGTLSGVNCIYANYVDAQNNNYAGHTQLARVATPAQGGDPNRSTSQNATLQTLQASDLTIITPPYLANLHHHFAGGIGQVHIYGKDQPYTLYPK